MNAESQSNKSLQVIILAAGKGTRMYSNLPKVLHKLAGKSLVEHVIKSAEELEAESISLVYGHGGEQVKDLLIEKQLFWCEQKEQLGTGHAVQQAVKTISDAADVLILYGDVPLLSSGTLNKLREAKQDSSLALLTARLTNPHGYGRIVRDNKSKIEKIVEEKDASETEKVINEINSGVMIIDGDKLKLWLTKIGNNNAQGEYYLTDLIELAVLEGETVNSYIVDDNKQIEGINNKIQLAQLEREYQKRQAYTLMEKGVTLRDPARFDLRGSIETGQDVTIDINVIIEGHCKIGSNVTIGANTVLKNMTVGDNVEILENCILEKSIINNGCNIGPFARLRPETQLDENAKVGNFVEIKKAHIARGSKVNHLSYIGDTEMGENVNIGAGTITCNYDGAYKHLTKIGDNAFIGSNTALVAPIEIGEGATVGAGSTLSRNAEAEKLTFTRSGQKTLDGWKRPSK
ncbi:MAG: bifunctional UDP-N-acetylglucosamine diphosphorylase/glucosamine-1-phosphate N-acetyltransferase GlmU [gamma proteobacterium symbiont of Bathyaustriella thionipta]|nr:bifunctional UDP-N-acetylglucosamine diphosphorylase/glucosamine-1-phosphate N-acetyltransferase GlmU [gamma proteobacterium symbiont of Bathyaustriella thionipta]MCU7949189.1 bifunctional UDP-N-acetylglucosamine diphosphorylase/glucosamine-1-phosphate N-acetyltransferase GlmU [gamma proteobacterium symbiont of Bathyaustriella thionipta]MCU7952077.1 bifunctional UDP-N-acetylglucosamine diphosphorylase/glucosamine-1-phosphate N-acetyltransferase GlmU [gamma proteobacterium symbiont of Bathyaust